MQSNLEPLPTPRPTPAGPEVFDPIANPVGLGGLLVAAVFSPVLVLGKLIVALVGSCFAPRDGR